MKKIVAIMALGASFLFAQINLQTASKEELMNIKGIGEKKAEQIIQYRQTSKISNPEDLKNIKGFGDSIVDNVKNDVKVKEKSTKKVKEIEKESKEKATDEVNKKIDSKSKKLEEKALKKLN